MSTKRKTRKSIRRRNPAKQTSKRYRCTQCGHEQMQTTNHYGPTWSHGHMGACPKCPPYKKYPEFGGQTIWECMEPQSETRAILQNGKRRSKKRSARGLKALGACRRKYANPPMTFAKVAMYGAGAYLLCKYVFFKNS